MSNKKEEPSFLLLIFFICLPILLISFSIHEIKKYNQCVSGFNENRQIEFNDECLKTYFDQFELKKEWWDIYLTKYEFDEFLSKYIKDNENIWDRKNILIDNYVDRIKFDSIDEEKKKTYLYEFEKLKIKKQNTNRIHLNENELDKLKIELLEKQIEKLKLEIEEIKKQNEISNI